VGSRRGVVGGPQLVALQFILLTVVHANATRGKGLSCPDIATSSTLSTLAATEEGEDGKDDVSESHDTDSGDKSDDEALVLAVHAEIAFHAIAVAEIVAEGVSVGGCGGGISGGCGAVSVAIGGSQGRVRGCVVGIGSGPGWDILLELFGGLIATGDFTACGAFLKSECDVIGDLISNLFDLRLVDAKSSRENIGGETKESLSDLVYAWERVSEEGDEGYRLTTVVVLKMDGTLGEESGLVSEDLVEDELSAVLGDHARDERAVGDKIELWGPRMGMRGVHSAWSKETGSD